MRRTWRAPTVREQGAGAHSRRPTVHRVPQPLRRDAHRSCTPARERAEAARDADGPALFAERVIPHRSRASRPLRAGLECCSISFTVSVSQRHVCKTSQSKSDNTMVQHYGSTPALKPYVRSSPLCNSPTASALSGRERLASRLRRRYQALPVGRRFSPPCSPPSQTPAVSSLIEGAPSSLSVRSQPQPTVLSSTRCLCPWPCAAPTETTPS